jgi:hypothetical protein
METHIGHDRLEVIFLDVDDTGRHAALVGWTELGVVVLHPRDGSLEGIAFDAAIGLEIEGRFLAVYLLGK